MREYKHLDVTLDDDVLRVTFDRPDRMNAVNSGVHEELSYVFDDANRYGEEHDARVVVVTGKGDAFCAGGDIKGMDEGIRWDYHESRSIVEDIVNCELPIIAKVNGDAVGLGATIALACDIVIASEEARIGDTHTSVGLVAGDGGAVVWPMLVGPNKAKEMLMTGNLLSAEEGKELGLFNHVISEDELDGFVKEMVDDLATSPQWAIRYTKMSINTLVRDNINQVLLQGLALERNSVHHPDHEEAVKAFKENRKPDFPSARSPSE
jgi:enoyl-CoA hydratase